MANFEFSRTHFWVRPPALQVAFCSHLGHKGTYYLFVDRIHLIKIMEDFSDLTWTRSLAYRMECCLLCFGHCDYFSSLRLSSSKQGQFPWLIIAPGAGSCLIITFWWNAFIKQWALQGCSPEGLPWISLFKQPDGLWASVSFIYLFHPHRWHLPFFVEYSLTLVEKRRNQ